MKEKTKVKTKDKVRGNEKIKTIDKAKITEKESFITTCKKFDDSGKGYLELGGERYFLAQVLPEEELHVEIERKGKRSWVSSFQIVKENPNRVQPQCTIYDRCGGCQLQHLSYAGQLQYKTEKVRQLLSKFCQTEEIIGMKNPWNYRNKIIATFSYSKKGKVAAGIYEEDSHQVIPYSFCRIQDSRADKIIHTICELMNEFRIRPYQEDYDEGLVRHCLIRVGEHSSQISVCLVVSSPIFPARKQFVTKLRKIHPEITTLTMNVNSRSTSVVMGNQDRILYGDGFITDQLCGLNFSLSAKSFYQVNSRQTEVLYNKAMEMAELKGTEKVLDAYCGIGTISLIAAQQAKEVLGVEVNKTAVKDAIGNMRANKIRNAYFMEADAGEFMELAAKNQQHFDVVIMDPPRAGADEKFLKALCALKPEKVIYISCDPKTLARDVEILVRNRYSAKIAVPVDMFPMTTHIETVVLLTRNTL